MVNAREQIRKTRTSLEQQKRKVETAISKIPQITQQSLRQLQDKPAIAQRLDKRYTKGAVDSPLMGRLRRRRILAEKGELSSLRGKLTKEKEDYERDVAEKAPEYALPKYKSQAYQKAVQAIKQKIAQETRPNSRMDVKFLKESLKLDKDTLIKAYYSGFLYKEAGEQKVASQVRGERIQTAYKEFKALKGQEGSLTQDVYQRYIKRGYSEKDASRLAAWASEKGMTPSPTKEREILIDPRKAMVYGGKDYAQMVYSGTVRTAAEIKKLTPTFERAGYTPQEAREISRYSVYKSITPTTTKAQDVLERGIFPELLPKGYLITPQRKIESAFEIASRKIDEYYRKKLKVDPSLDVVYKPFSFNPFRLEPSSGLSDPRILRQSSRIGDFQPLSQNMNKVPPKISPKLMSVSVSTIDQDRTKGFKNLLFGGVKVTKTTAGRAATGLASFGTYMIPVVGEARLFVDIGATAERVVRGEKVSALEVGTAAVGAGFLSASAALRQKSFMSYFRTGTQTRPILARNIAKEATLRQRATIIVKDRSTGKILYEVDKNTGTFILAGGAVDKGETALQAARRELYEETGLRAAKLKKVDVVSTATEKNYVYEVLVNKKDLNLKAQAKEVKGFKWIKPKTYTGATAAYPMGKKPSLFSRSKRLIRTDDFLVGSRYQAIKELKKLSNEEIKQITPIAREWAKRNFGESAIKGIPTKEIIREYRLSKGKRLSKELIIPARDDRPEILIGFGSRYDIPPSKTKKYTEGKQFFVRGSPTKVETGGITETGEQLAKGEFAVQKRYMKRGEKVFFWQPPSIPKGRGYLGVAYLKLLTKVKKEGMDLTFTRRTPTIQTTTGEIGDGFILTRKALRGSELEAGSPIGTVLKVIKEERPVYLARQKVRIQRVELRKAAKGELTQAEIGQTLANFERLSKQEQKAFTRRVKRETGADYEYMMFQDQRYVPPTKFGEPFVGSMLTSESSQAYTTKSKPPKYKYRTSYKSEEKYTPLKIKEPERPRPSPRPQYPRTPYITDVPSYTPTTYRPSKYTIPTRIKTPPYTPPRYKTPTTPRTPRIPSETLGSTEPTKILEEPRVIVKGFDVYVKRKGKWVKIKGALPKSKAIELGARTTKRTLAASFKIEESDQLIKISPKEQRQTQLGKEFRAYKIRKGKRIPQENLWIQRKPFRLGTRSERREIQQAKKQASYFKISKKSNRRSKTRGWL